MVSPVEMASLVSSDNAGKEEREAIRKDAKKEREAKDKELRKVHERELGRERDFQVVLAKASEVIAEHRTKVEMISMFVNGVGNYAEVQAKYNQEIKNLECAVEEMEKELQPHIQNIEKLEESVSNLIFL